MSNLPAGWYDDGSGTQRYWDGQGWTEHTAPQQPVAPQGYGPPAGHQPGYRPPRRPLSRGAKLGIGIGSGAAVVALGLGLGLGLGLQPAISTIQWLQGQWTCNSTSSTGGGQWSFRFDGLQFVLTDPSGYSPSGTTYVRASGPFEQIDGYSVEIGTYSAGQFSSYYGSFTAPGSPPGVGGVPFRFEYGGLSYTGVRTSDSSFTWTDNYSGWSALCTRTANVIAAEPIPPLSEQQVVQAAHVTAPREIVSQIVTSISAWAAANGGDAPPMTSFTNPTTSADLDLSRSLPSDPNIAVYYSVGNGYDYLVVAAYRDTADSTWYSYYGGSPAQLTGAVVGLTPASPSTFGVGLPWPGALVSGG